VGAVPGALSLPTLLSSALVAFTIEFDNTAEARMIHQTTLGKESKRGPWLVSQVLWANVVRCIPDDGIAVPTLHQRARTERSLLNGLQRWGYIVVQPARGDMPPVVHLKLSGWKAREVWQHLATEIEGRWAERHGRSAVDSLRVSLTGVIERLDRPLPHYLPPVFPAQGGRAEDWTPRESDGVRERPTDLDLSALLAQVLHAFTLDFESQTKLGLAMCANTLRVVTEEGVRVRDLPRLTGVSKEANTMCTGYFERHGHVVVEPDPSASRGKIVRLTSAGSTRQHRYQQLVRETEANWAERFGGDEMGRLRAALETPVGDNPVAGTSPLFHGLDPVPGGWRSTVPRPATLPHYPMVLHRGGYPDGS
jgi:DNA-binding MarR family transcriptional regulator